LPIYTPITILYALYTYSVRRMVAGLYLYIVVRLRRDSCAHRWVSGDVRAHAFAVQIIIYSGGHHSSPPRWPCWPEAATTWCPYRRPSRWKCFRCPWSGARGSSSRTRSLWPSARCGPPAAAATETANARPPTAALSETGRHLVCSTRFTVLTRTSKSRLHTIKCNTVISYNIQYIIYA